MCNPQPAPRCSADSCKKVDSLEKKIASTQQTIANIDASIVSAHKNGSKASDIDRLFQKKNQAVNKLADERLKHRDALRDYDGTKAGRKALEAKIMEAKTEKEYNELQTRLTCSSIILLTRRRATDLKQREVDPRSKILLPQAA